MLEILAVLGWSKSGQSLMVVKRRLEGNRGIASLQEYDTQV